jgi:glutathione S-transferase
MIVVHHLNNSRSQRILWLLEELDTPYQVETYRRDAKTNLAPSELRAVHPLGKSPVIQDGDLVLAERHGNGRLVPARGTNEHVRYLHWMHLPMAPSCCTWWRGSILGGSATLQRRCKLGRMHDRRRARLVEAEPTHGGHMAGAEFSAADVQIMFPLEFAAFGGLVAPAMPDCAITSPGCRPGLLTAERWTGVAPTPSMPRARMTPRRSRNQAADASLSLPPAATRIGAEIGYRS